MWCICFWKKQQQQVIPMIQDSVWTTKELKTLKPCVLPMDVCVKSSGTRFRGNVSQIKWIYTCAGYLRPSLSLRGLFKTVYSPNIDWVWHWHLSTRLFSSIGREGFGCIQWIGGTHLLYFAIENGKWLLRVGEWVVLSVPGRSVYVCNCMCVCLPACLCECVWAMLDRKRSWNSSSKSITEPPNPTKPLLQCKWRQVW